MTPTDRQAEAAYRTVERLGIQFGNAPVTVEQEEAAKHAASCEVRELVEWERKQNEK